jgi:hypothetical protein
VADVAGVADGRAGEDIVSDDMRLSMLFHYLFFVTTCKGSFWLLPEEVCLSGV